MSNGKYLKINKTLDKKLIKEFNHGNMVAYCTLHNIFHYDISKAITNTDFNRLAVCKNMDKRKEPTSNNLGYLWFVIIVILIILLAFAIARIGR